MNIVIIFTAQYLYLVAILVAVIFFFTRIRRIQKNIAISGGIIGVLSYAISRISSFFYYDPRPFVTGHFTPLIAHAADNGFPSNHTLLVGVIAMTLWFYDKKLSGLMWLLAILVGLARVMSGVHHIVDILGSIAIVLVAGFIHRFFWRKYDLI